MITPTVRAIIRPQTRPGLNVHPVPASAAFILSSAGTPMLNANGTPMRP
jgi:hypothetical protein